MIESLHVEEVRCHPDAEWMVLVHGAGGSTRTWRRQRESLSKQYNLLLVDLPDHGESKQHAWMDSEYTFALMGQALWQAVNRARLERVHIMGLSLGAILAQEMVRQQPTRVISCLLGGAIVRLDFKLRVIANTSLALAKVLGFRRFYKLAARIALPRGNHKKSRDVFIRESQALSISAFERWTRMYTGLYIHLEALFERTPEVPTLMVMGGQDHLFGKQAKRYAKRHGVDAYRTIPGCGHVVSIERPTTFNQYVLEFLAALPRKRTLPTAA